jgi:hypothetical protein
MSIRDVSIAQKRSLVTIEPIANSHHAGEHMMSGNPGGLYGVPVDETFSVWNLVNYEGIVTSQNIPGLRNSEIRLSSKGKYAVSYGKASFVYELP